MGAMGGLISALLAGRLNPVATVRRSGAKLAVRGAAALLALAAGGFVVAGCYRLVEAWTDPLRAPFLVAAGLLVVSAVVLVASGLVAGEVEEVAGKARDALDGDEPGENPGGDIAALARDLGVDLGGRVSPLTAVGIALAAGFLYGCRR